MIPGSAEVSWGQLLSGMQLAGRLALSAAALLLVALAYRYYKSRGSPGRPQEGSGAAAKATPDGEATPPPVVSSRAGREETLLQGLRHRGSQRKGRQPKNGGSRNPSMEPAGLAGTAGLKGAPAGRVEEEEMEEEGQRKGEDEGHPSPGLQPDKQRLVLQEDGNQEERTPGTLLAGARAAGGMDETRLGSPFCTSDSDRERPGREAGSGEAELCLPLCGSRWVGGGPQQTSEDESSLGSSCGHPLGGGGGGRGLARHPGWTEETQLKRKKVLSFRGTSDLGLASSQLHVASCAAYTVSSVAEMHVQGSPIREGESEEEENSSHAEPPWGNPRGQVYNCDVQSVMNEHSYASREPPPPYGTFIMDTPYELEMAWPPPDMTSAVSENGEGGAMVQKVPPPSPAASEGEIKMGQPEDQKGVASGENPTQRPPGPRCGIRRKESFHKILENPELQVPMEGFGSPAPESAGRDAPSLASLRSSSVSSLLGSVRSIQSNGSEEPTVELVAGAKFLHFPMSSETSVDVVRLDLGNCYEVLRMAKKQKLEALQEAAYKVMSDNYLQVLRTNAIYGRLKAMERDLILQKRMRGRKRLTVADIGSQEHVSHTSRLCYYDEQMDTWHPLTHLPVEAISKGCALCSMFNYLFVAAGCEGRGRHQRPSNRVFCYNPLTNIWREICPLNQARPHCKLVALDGCLYAIGGECLYTVERYDPRTDRWSFAAPLPNDTFAVAHTAAVCDGEIYVTGGTLRYILLRYVPRLDAWKVSLTGGNKDRTTEMVSTGGFIYRFDLNRNLGIGVYRCSARAKLWYECATHPMPFPACFQCAVVENLVYCISRQFHLRFLADHISPRFGTKELQHFPSPRGTLFPATLVLPDSHAVQTRV